MRDNLRLYHTTMAQIRKWLPNERITRVRNLALFLTGLYLSRKVHLSLIARKWPSPGKEPSLVNRLRRFLDNPKACVRDYWEAGEEEPWYLATDQAATWRTLRMYKVWMWTEEMYGDMKGHGFDLEATHLQCLDRLSRLVLGVCVVYVWLIALGSGVVKNGQRHLVDRKDRRDKSYFRLGWDWLERCLAQGQSLRLRFAPCGPK
jgi:hypothetical protein